MTIIQHWLKGDSPEEIAAIKNMTVEQVVKQINKDWVAL